MHEEVLAGLQISSLVIECVDFTYKLKRKTIVLNSLASPSQFGKTNDGGGGVWLVGIVI
jgi:hypothetical protein